MLTTNAVLQQNRYRILQTLENSGSSLPVYKAFDENQKREVILKEVPAEFEESSSVKLEKLLDLKHEAFQKVLEIFEEAGKRYLVIENIDGDTLSQLIERNKRPFPLSDVANWANELLDALIYLHSHIPPLIHQNIKPQNLRLTVDGKIKLDISEIGRTPQAKVGATITNQNLHFIPFEIIFDQLDSASQKVLLNDYDEKSVEILKSPPDTKSDIYSLGATLYYLLTARPPVDPLERSIEILEGKPDPLVSPTQYNPKVPLEIAEAIIKALEIKRENRFDSAAIMRQFLKTAFVRIKEKQKADSSTVETNLEDILEIEAEPVPVVDLVRKLQEAEAKRLEAEKRAAEAEKKLQESFSTRTQNLGLENSTLFAEEELPSSGMNKMKLAIAGAAVFVFLIVGVAVFALLNSGAPDVDKQAQTQVKTTSDSRVAPESQQTTQTQTTSTQRNQSEGKDQTQTTSVTRSERQTQERRSSAVAQQPETKPQPKREDQTQQQQQKPKKVTVDDLINDN